MVTYAQVRQARPAAWDACAVALRRLASVLVSRADSLGGATTRLRAGWNGPAAEAAERRMRALAESLAELHPLLLTADQILADHAGRVAHAQRVSDVPAATAAASATDAEAAARLGALVPELDPAGPQPAAPAWVPPPGSDPGLVRRWWEGLPESARRWMLVGDPARLGRLDGVPSAARDQANRLVFTRERERLAGRTDAPSAATVRGLDAILARLERDQPARAYLLGLDTTGRGRAIVAVGDPDRAADVLTYVPGAGSRLSAAGGLLTSTDRLAVHADRPAGAPAVVLWLGYDAPDSLLGASRVPGARAESDLDQFTDGLRATHEGARAHQTVLGHSYGSTLVGYTAATRGLDVDDIVVVGSPGIGAAHAGDLGVPADHVWSGTARYDPIRLTGLAHALPLSLRWPDDAGSALWFGADPSRPEFGGHVFTTEPGSLRDPGRAHGGYFDEGNDALDDIGAITVGDYDAVR